MGCRNHSWSEPAMIAKVNVLLCAGESREGRAERAGTAVYKRG